jgi:hypothetical protein|nr:MAG TPA: hypothetical protein [Caudoviricetes sp.]
MPDVWDFSEIKGTDTDVIRAMYAGEVVWEKDKVLQSLFFTSSGNFPIPDDLQSLTVRVISGGGARGRDFLAASGNPGGYGGVAVKIFNSDDLAGLAGQTLAVTVGAGGPYGKDYEAYAGGVSSFGNLLSASAGTGGWSGAAGGAGQNGTGIGGDVNTNATDTTLSVINGFHYGLGGGRGGPTGYDGAPGCVLIQWEEYA